MGPGPLELFLLLMGTKQKLRIPGKMSQCGMWSLERKIEHQWQPSLHNSILSHRQSILVTLKPYFIFLFIIFWTYIRMMPFNALDPACDWLSTTLMRRWTQLGSELRKSWQVNVLIDSAGPRWGCREVTGDGTVRMCDCVGRGFFWVSV